MNTTAAASAAAQTAGIAFENCACGYSGLPGCVAGQCVLCEPTPDGTPGCGGTPPPDDGGVIGYDGGVILEDGGVIGYDGGVIVEDGGVIGYDGGEACPDVGTVGSGASCSYEGEYCDGWISACGGIVEGCYCEGTWVCPPVDCVDAGPRPPTCARWVARAGRGERRARCAARVRATATCASSAAIRRPASERSRSNRSPAAPLAAAAAGQAPGGMAARRAARARPVRWCARATAPTPGSRLRSPARS